MGTVTTYRINVHRRVCLKSHKYSFRLTGIIKFVIHINLGNVVITPSQCQNLSLHTYISLDKWKQLITRSVILSIVGVSQRHG